MATYIQVARAGHGEWQVVGMMAVKCNGVTSRARMRRVGPRLPRRSQMLLSLSSRCLRRQALQRCYATSSDLASYAYTRGDPASPAVSSTPNVSEAQHHALDSALRVDQAGELAAVSIYKGQMLVLGRDNHLGPMLQVGFIYISSSHITMYCRKCLSKRKNILQL